ncbi:hypothetical protein TMatcc_003193 [Talaromyces marneffei ATCC 18224]|uniref:uncharacterized protein n=1 Tax=Talaromyces marneffei TaxID=37727 RepID=UPI0012AAAC0C|nr:uncharacterized protein EYB26_001742 [Talaromyces marneffei]KAE8555895.1 hypothetical protein EYB25_000593 [Talaromyces marneffei]QGA14089.1 hypothetical protein EYB26_001742 [Talaromyces marneffei]
MENSKQSWLDVFKTSGMRRRLFIMAFLGLFTQWSGNTLITYYLSNLIGVTDSVVKSKINIGIACWGLITGTTAALLAPREVHQYEEPCCCHTNHFLYFASSLDYNIGYNALTYTYLVEIFPYTSRSRGIAWFQFYGRGAAFFATYTNLIGLPRIAWKWLVVYCCWLAFEIIFIYLFFPETAGRTLEELSFLFEGKEKANEVANAAVTQIFKGAEEKRTIDTAHVEVVDKGRAV